MDIGPTLAFARRLAERRRPVWVRYVLVPSWSDHPADVEGVARFAAGLGNVQRVDVLPSTRWDVSSGSSSVWSTGWGRPPRLRRKPSSGRARPSATRG